VGASTSEVVKYPLSNDDALELNPAYKDLQKKGPIKVQLPYGEPCWLATRYDDARMVYGDRRFSRAIGLTHDWPAMHPGMDRAKDPTLLLNMDPPEHTRLRRLTSGAFSPQRVRALRDTVQELADGLLDNMADQGAPADFVSLYSSQLPPAVLMGILGVPRDDVKTFRNWVDTATAIDVDDNEREDSQRNVGIYIADLIADRRQRPTDDLLSALVEAKDKDDRLSELELISLCFALWFGGFETTVIQLGSTVYTLMTHRDHWQELLDDPALLPAALEELWRWIPSFKYGFPFVRWASEDLELSGGTLIRAGEPVLPEHAVANRDESVFANGWELDFHRDNPRPHLSLAFGAHHCMGAHLAHLQIEVSMQTLLRRLPKLELAVPAEDITWSPSTFMRSVESLPVAW
jgi:cytochrome P450